MSLCLRSGSLAPAKVELGHRIPVHCSQLCKQLPEQPKGSQSNIWKCSKLGVIPSCATLSQSPCSGSLLRQHFSGRGGVEQQGLGPQTLAPCAWKRIVYRGSQGVWFLQLISSCTVLRTSPPWPGDQTRPDRVSGWGDNTTSLYQAQLGSKVGN